MGKYKPIFSSVAGALVVLVCFGGTWYLHSHGGKKHSTSRTSSSSTVRAAEAGFALANALNAQPPTSNKLIGEVGCNNMGSTYKCVFIGNNSGQLYCVGYTFTVGNSRFSNLHAQALNRSVCGF